MSKNKLIATCCSILCVVVILFLPPVIFTLKQTQIATDVVYFSPVILGQVITVQKAIINEIAKPHKSILVQAYSVTDTGIASALVTAKKSGVDVQVILDRSDFSDDLAFINILVAGGVVVYNDSNHAIAHNKLIIFDGGTTVINGSYNYTLSALNHNAENIRIRYNDPCGSLFVSNWLYHSKEPKTTLFK